MKAVESSVPTSEVPIEIESLSALAAKANVSLTMIVRDEERVLEECLRSAKGVFTQIVVVDTGSRDRSMEIASTFGVDQFEVKWKDSFAEARNIALSKATGDWVFWMDADDTLPPDSARAILQAAIEAPADVVGFIVPVQYPGADSTRVDHLKLFRNLKGLQWCYRVHEQIYPSLVSRGRIERIDACILHSNYDATPAGRSRKRARNERLLKLDLKDFPNDAVILFNLGAQAHDHSHHKEAAQWLEESIKRSKPAESHVRKAFALLAGSRQALGDVQGALVACEIGLKVVGEDPELRFRCGQALAGLGRFEEAKQQYLLVSDPAHEYLKSLDMAIIGPKRDHNLALVCAELGEQFEAKEWLRKAIDAGFAQSAVVLFEYAFDQNDLVTAGSALDNLRALEGVTGLWTVLAMKLAAHRGQSEESFLEEMVSHHPEATAPALLLAKRLLDAGREQEAEPYLKFLEKKGQADAPFLRGAIAGRKGEFIPAIAHTQRALELEPNHEGAMRQLEVLKRAMGQG